MSVTSLSHSRKALTKRRAPADVKVPKLCAHRNGQAFITFKNQRYYLGPIGSEKAARAYQDAIQQIRLGQQYQPPVPERENKILNELILLYLRHAQAEHGPSNSESKEFYHIKKALQILSKNCGDCFGNQFGPLKLQLLQQLMLRNNWSARYINRLINRIKNFIRWCCAQELMPAEQYHKLQSVQNLKPGKHGAPRAKKVRPVDFADVQAVLPFVKPVIRDMILVQFACGMRPQDVTNIRPCDIQTDGEIWLYRPHAHKNAWRDKKLTKAIPASAQQILQPYLNLMGLTSMEYIFSPLRSEKERRIKPSKRKKRAIGAKYKTSSYGHALKYGFDKAARRGVELKRWSLNQLRHSVATDISRELGQQQAQVYLGHAHLETTAIYAERTERELVEVAKRADKIVSPFLIEVAKAEAVAET
jgi:integrase